MIGHVERNNYTGSGKNQMSNTGGFSNMMTQGQSVGSSGQQRGYSPSKPKWKQGGPSAPGQGSSQ